MFNRGDYDNIAFLSFSYIGVEEKIARSCYTAVLKDLGYIIQGRNFDDLIKEFSEVEISKSGLRFIHPSYADAFGFALIDNFKPNNICINIFSNVLLNLSEASNASYFVARTVALNFDKLPDKVRNDLLIKILEKSRSVNDYHPSFYGVIYYHNDDIFKNINTLDILSRIIANNFDKLPENLRNKLLLELSKEENAADYVAWTIANNFDKLPEYIQNILFNFLEKEKTSKFSRNWEPRVEGFRLFSLAAFEVERNYIGKDVRAVAWAVEDNFDKLPENVRNELLPKLSKMEPASKYLARTIVNNFAKINEKIRTNILIQLSINHVTAVNLHDAFKFSYDKLPTNVRNMLNLNLGLGGIALENIGDGTNMKNETSSNFVKRLKLLDLLKHNWDFNPNKFEYADTMTVDTITILQNKKKI